MIGCALSAVEFHAVAVESHALAAELPAQGCQRLATSVVVWADDIEANAPLHRLFGVERSPVEDECAFSKRRVLDLILETVAGLRERKKGHDCALLETSRFVITRDTQSP